MDHDSPDRVQGTVHQTYEQNSTKQKTYTLKKATNKLKQNAHIADVVDTSYLSKHEGLDKEKCFPWHL